MYTLRHCVSASELKAHHGCSGLQARTMFADRYAACGEDEDAVSMALTVMQRLLGHCGVQPAEVGALRVGATLLDRSKSMKTELMALLEAGEHADAEGVDHACASNGGPSALQSCFSWAQSESWDGRWAVAVCSNDQVALIDHPVESASAAALLVGRGSPMQVDSEQLARLEYLLNPSPGL